MLLKRLYDHTGGAPAVRGVKVLRTSPRQHFSPRFIEGGIAEGWLSMADRAITIHAEGGRITYRIERGPGYYCCYCGKKVDDSSGARAHIQAAHASRVAAGDEEAGTVPPSPDPENPAGYRKNSYYDCVRED